MMEYIYLGGLMDKTELNDEVQIDLSELFKLIRKHLKSIVIFMLIGAILVGAYTAFMVDKKYSSQGTILLKAEVIDGAIDNNQWLQTTSNYYKGIIFKIRLLKTWIFHLV